MLRACPPASGPWLAVLALFLSAPGRAESRSTRVSVAVDFVSQAAEEAWFAAALEEDVARELSRFGRLAIADERLRDRLGCPARTTSCLLAAYGRAGVEIVVTGELGAASLRWEVFETWTPAAVASGKLDVGPRSSAARLRPEIAKIVRPIVRPGGLVDLRPLSAAGPAQETFTAGALAIGATGATPASPTPSGAAGAPETAAAGAGPPAPSPAAPATDGAAAGANGAAQSDAPGIVGQAASAARRLLASSSVAHARASVLLDRARSRAATLARAAPLFELTLAALIILLASPLVLGRFLNRSRPHAGGDRPVTARWLAAMVMLLSLVLVAHALPRGRELWSRGLAALAGASELAFLLPLTGGVAWGWLVLSAAGFAFPRVGGLERVRHDALWPVLRAWFWVAMQRVALLAMAAVLLLVPAAFALLAGAGARVTWMIVVPAAALIGQMCFLALVDNLAAYLDGELVLGPASTANPWHGTIKKYLLGYLRRTGLALDPRIIDRTLFLPGKVDDIVSYGGGWTRPRVLVSAELRERALGEMPLEQEQPARTVRPEALPLGIIAPCTNAEEHDRAARRRAVRGEHARREHLAAKGRGRGAVPRVLGENTTLLGWVMPTLADESIPLISNSQEDFGVVHELLTEHYAAFEKNLDEDEHDDTDPTNKDFLFGALLCELGKVLRGDSSTATPRLTAHLVAERSFGLARAAGRALRGLRERFASRHPATLADAYAALNFGRDHLIQHLYALATGDTSRLTSRAPLPLLYRTSNDLLDAVATLEPDAQDRQVLRATPRNRLVWLSRLFYVPIPDRRGPWRRVAAVLGVTVALAAVAGVAVHGALAYRPVYLERLKTMEERLRAAQQGAQDGGQHQGDNEVLRGDQQERPGD